MASTTADLVDDRIRFYCTSHSTQLPIVTLHERRWAYCPGGYVAARDGHDWAAIEPTQISQLNPRHVGFVVVGKANQALRVVRTAADR